MNKKITTLTISAAILVAAAIGVNAANELRTHLDVTYSPAGTLFEKHFDVNVNVAATNFSGGVQGITNFPTAFQFNNVTAQGYAYFRNISGTGNSVTIGGGTNFVAGGINQQTLKLLDGEFAIIRLNSNAWWGVSASNNCPVEFAIFPN